MPSETPPAVRLVGIGMRYGDAEEVLRDLDLVLEAGSFHYLVGPNGAGKTSLLKLLALSLPPARGRIELFGEDVARLDGEALARLRRRIGMVFQDFRLLEHLDLFDNVALPLRIAGLDEARVAEIVEEMLAWSGLEAVARRRPGELAMGQRQLAAIARAVVVRPRLLLADEPLSHLDPDRARRIMHLFIQLHRLGTTVLIATHNLELIRRFPFPVLELEAGRLVRADAAGARAAE